MSCRRVAACRCCAKRCSPQREQKVKWGRLARPGWRLRYAPSVSSHRRKRRTFPRSAAQNDLKMPCGAPALESAGTQHRDLLHLLVLSPLAASPPPHSPPRIQWGLEAPDGLSPGAASFPRPLGQVRAREKPLQCGAGGGGQAAGAAELPGRGGPLRVQEQTGRMAELSRSPKPRCKPAGRRRSERPSRPFSPSVDPATPPGGFSRVASRRPSNDARPDRERRRVRAADSGDAPLTSGACSGLGGRGDQGVARPSPAAPRANGEWRKSGAGPRRVRGASRPPPGPACPAPAASQRPSPLLCGRLTARASPRSVSGRGRRGERGRPRQGSHSARGARGARGWPAG